MLVDCGECVLLLFEVGAFSDDVCRGSGNSVCLAPLIDLAVTLAQRARMNVYPERQRSKGKRRCRPPQTVWQAAWDLLRQVVQLVAFKLHGVP